MSMTDREKEKRKAQSVRLLFRLEEKQATRPLYEQTFADSRAYTDFYYEEKCRDNVIAVKEESLRTMDGPKPETRLLSMAHLNPYLLSVRGLPVRTYMLAAVATVPERRREGHMRDVLEAAFGWLAEWQVPFAILLPVDPAIYEPFGFETVCKFTEKEPAAEALAKDYDVYILPDQATRDRRVLARAVEAALSAAGQQDEDWPEDPVIMAKVTDAAAFDRMAGQPFLSDADRLAWLRSLRICVSEGV